MTPATRGQWRTPLRAWWALPGLTVAGTAIGLAVVVGPTLGEHVPIPRQLVLPATETTVAPTPPARHAVKPPRHPSPKPSATPAPIVPPQTHVVTPRRPVVTASSDDGQEHESGYDQPGIDVEGTDR